MDSSTDEIQVAQWVKDQALATRFVVVNDSELVLAAGTPAGWGVALISGTGSVCLGRNADGKSARVGGWGPLLGDEGSGYHIASLALRRATQAADDRVEAQALLKAILRHWKLTEPTALIRHVHDPDHHDGGHRRPGHGRGRPRRPQRRRRDGGGGGSGARPRRFTSTRSSGILRLTRPPVALGGGLMLRGALRKTMLAAVKSELGPITTVADPPLGAVVMARRLLQGSLKPS